MNFVRTPAAAWVLALGTLLTLTIIAFGWSVPALRSSASAGSHERMEASFVGTPRWMTPSDLAPIQEVALREAGPSAYDRAGLERARAALEASGWFDSVAQVRRTSSSKIEIDGTFAEPTALVADRDGDHLVDSRGRLMPRSYAFGTAPAITRITGVFLKRPSRPGEMWPGADLLAGLEMAKLVASQRWRAQIASIDVSSFREFQTISLTTTGGCRLNWGRAPGAEAAAEVPASQKLRYIDLLQSQHGRLDAAGPHSIDLSVDYVGSR
ncbi:MAG: hypothetical protein EXS03_01850 [Phycisphaerales bacterium]|nr:hypothetical protein [Phycisphaerales bacterium]